MTDDGTADLTADGLPPDADASDGHEPASEAGKAMVLAEAPADRDPNAVRARLGPSSSLGHEPVVRVGLTAVEGVSAQRQPVVDGRPRDVELIAQGRGRHVLRDGGDRTAMVLSEPSATPDGLVTEVLVDGFRFEVETVVDRRASLRERATRAGATAAASGPLAVRAVIPGKVGAVSVAVGDTVTAGQHLLVVEAMKMQNELRSPRDGTISRIGAGPGDNIDVGDVLVVIS